MNHPIKGATERFLKAIFKHKKVPAYTWWRIEINGIIFAVYTTEMGTAVAYACELWQAKYSKTPLYHIRCEEVRQDAFGPFPGPEKMKELIESGRLIFQPDR